MTNRPRWFSGNPALRLQAVAAVTDSAAAAGTTAGATAGTTAGTAAANAAVSAAVATALASALAADAVDTLNAQTAGYTLVLTDAGKLVQVTNASGQALTVPPNSSVAFPVGTVIDVVQAGAGLVTITAGGGVTIQKLTTLKLNGQWSVARLRKVATDTWIASGDLAAS